MASEDEHPLRLVAQDIAHSAMQAAMEEAAAHVRSSIPNIDLILQAAGFDHLMPAARPPKKKPAAKKKTKPKAPPRPKAEPEPGGVVELVCEDGVWKENE
jgi:hypothetical protein